MPVTTEIYLFSGQIGNLKTKNFPILETKMSKITFWRWALNRKNLEGTKQNIKNTNLIECDETFTTAMECYPLKKLWLKYLLHMQAL